MSGRRSQKTPRARSKSRSRSKSPASGSKAKKGKGSSSSPSPTPTKKSRGKAKNVKAAAKTGGVGIKQFSWLQAIELVVYVAVFATTFSPSFLSIIIEDYPVVAGSWSLLLSLVSFYMVCERLVLEHILESSSILSLLPSRMYQMKSMYANGFTRIVIFWQIASSLNRPVLEAIYAMVAVSSWAALISFHAVLLVDQRAHKRLADHVGSPLVAFSLGNLIVHGFPCLVAVYYPPQFLNIYSGIGAAAAQITWGLAQTIGNKSGLFVLDEVYAPCPKKTWWSLWIVALVVNIVYPFVGVTAK